LNSHRQSYERGQVAITCPRFVLCDIIIDSYAPMAYIYYMEIIETPIFTKTVTDLLSDEEYNKLQQYLVYRPDAGALIVGGGGLRKVRWNLPGRGKSGGTRTIYYWDYGDRIYMLFCYPKNEQEDLTPKQLTILRKYIKENLL
jgi:hypothetical protein